MKTLTTVIKILSLVAGGAAYADAIPPKLLPVAALVFALASTLKDVVRVIGDWLDNKKLDQSFNP